MKRYKLLKDLPTFKAGDLFELQGDGCLWLLCPLQHENHWKPQVMAYHRKTLKHFPNILRDWFEEIHEKPKTVWDLEEGDECWRINDGDVRLHAWHGWYYEKDGRGANEYFLTKEDAEREFARRKAKVILERDTNGFKPDWNDTDQRKWCVCYNYVVSSLFARWDDERNYGLIYFATVDEAEASIRKHEKEWKAYLGVEE